MKISRSKTQESDQPLIEPTVGLLGLTSQSEVDPAVLSDLVSPDKVNLTLKGSSPVLLRRQPIRLTPLQLGGQLVRGRDQGVNHVLAIDRFEMATIWNQGNVTRIMLNGSDARKRRSSY